MDLFDSMSQQGHEQLVYFHCPDSGLKAVLAIHNTFLGPGLGGLRMWPYLSEQDALQDAMRLSASVTYTASIAGLNVGGAKGIIIGDPESDKSETLFRSLGKFIDSLNGRFVATLDVGTNTEDLEHLALETEHVLGVEPYGHGGSGDPAPMTAYGTLQGIRACLAHRYQSQEIRGRSFAIQGAGSVGRELIRRLSNEGAKVFVCDINHDRVQQAADEYGAEPVPMAEIYDVKANVFAPCAMGGVINTETIPRLRCDIVAGSAHNQLESESCGTELERRGITYAPDFAISSGGLINLASELYGYDTHRAERMVGNLFGIMENIFALAEKEQIPAWQAAKLLAEKRIADIAKIQRRYSRC